MTTQQIQQRIYRLHDKAWDLYDKRHQDLFWSIPWRRYWVVIEYYQGKIRERYKHLR